jgi:glycerophosphoryl diester phosphodiesterase
MSCPALLVAGLVAFALALAVQPPSAKRVVAHRGASAYAPEHTIAAYRLALEQRADFVEQDLAVTRDRVLVCIHDLTLERTTNVEEVFPERSSASPSDPKERRWLVNDFTLAEIKRLEAGPASPKERVPTFQEAIDLVRGKAGLYPELKDPAFYRARGIDPAKLLREAVERNGLDADPRTPLIVQSFDDETLKGLASILPRVGRVYLVEARSEDRLDSEAKVRAIAEWATGIGPNKEIVRMRPELVRWAHGTGLTVTPWTFSSRDAASRASVAAEMSTFLYEYGVDAVFTDNPDLFPRK